MKRKKRWRIQEPALPSWASHFSESCVFHLNCVNITAFLHHKVDMRISEIRNITVLYNLYKIVETEDVIRTVIILK